MRDMARMGVRVEVPFGKRKLYAGLVSRVHDRPPEYQAKEILAVLDDQPIINSIQLELWKWMTDYYVCSLGEVMHAALPSQLKLHSETVILPGPGMDDGIFDLSDNAYLIAEAVSIQKQLTIQQIQSILDIKTVYPVIKELLEKDVIELKEEMQSSYKPKKITAVRFGPSYLAAEDQSQVFDLTSRSEHQTRALLALIKQAKTHEHVTQEDILKMAEVTHQVMGALEKKGIIERYQLEVSRIDKYSDELETTLPLSDQQVKTISAIESENEVPVLLHGVTGSGKTRVYIELITKELARGKQVLYLLPEIALTTQIVGRLKKVFGDDLYLYHSKVNEGERVEVWRRLPGSSKVILAARSGMFLPFDNLGLIVVDEEHDASYKQQDPNPRYQARDIAVLMSNLHQCKIVLGSATPSIESYHNAATGKYHLVTMPDRFGDALMPEIQIIDLKKKAGTGHFSGQLLEAIEKNREAGSQTILFQNRRGFAPLMLCSNCGWSHVCRNCDIGLTYHQYNHNMQCHLCGYREPPALTCPDCGNHELTLKGFGTEMIEDEIKIRFPDYRTGRLDLDTARGKKQLEAILVAFESGKIDILIGTQMVTKGLDFEAVTLVGVINADQLLYYPDFRSSERAFQLMTQVSGRSGRRKEKGTVLIQAYNTEHPVIKEVLQHDYAGFYRRELSERAQFGFPPYTRLIEITTRHRRESLSASAAKFLVDFLTKRIGNRVMGPIKPTVARVRNRYVYHLNIKLEKQPKLIRQTKSWIDQAVIYLKKQEGMSTLRVAVDVDP